MRWNIDWARRSGAVVAAMAVAGAVAACGAGVKTNTGSGDGSPSPSVTEDLNAPDTFTSSAAGVVEKCAKVKVSLGEPKPAEGGPSQMRLPLTMTNAGGAACVLRGFPGARLQGQDSQYWDLSRTTAEAKEVRLTPGASTTAILTYLPEEDHDRKWDVVTLVVTPPDTEDSQTFGWPGDSVLRQDGATRPGSYIGPVGAWVSGGA